MVLPHIFYSIFLISLQNKVSLLCLNLLDPRSISIHNAFQDKKVASSGFWVKIMFRIRDFIVILSTSALYEQNLIVISVKSSL